MVRPTPNHFFFNNTYINHCSITIMNFNTGIKSISISKEAKKVFEELDLIRPKHISFSLMLAIAADEYVKQHNKGLVKLDDFNEDDRVTVPRFFSDMNQWINYVTGIDAKDKSDIKERLLQLQNLMDKI
jgi:hypothetical protein